MDLIATPSEIERMTNGQIKAATIRKHARSGKLKHVEKWCGTWLVNVTKELPALDVRREK